MDDTITVNLKHYEKFWQNFAARGAAYDASAIVTSEQAERWLLEWYGIRCRIHTGLTFGLVEMKKSDYTAFLLKWS